MPAIGYVQRQNDGSFKGSIRTLSVSAEIQIVPNRGKMGEQPDYRILAGGIELGGGWIRTGEVSQREYIRLAMSAPELGARTLYANLGRAPEPETPYQRAGQVWDERIGSARAQARSWRLMAIDGMALTVGLSCALVWQSLQSRVTPYVVEVDRLGEANAIAPASVKYEPSDAQIAWFLSRFITNIRSLSLDPVLTRLPRQKSIPKPWFCVVTLQE